MKAIEALLQALGGGCEDPQRTILEGMPMLRAAMNSPEAIQDRDDKNREQFRGASTAFMGFSIVRIQELEDEVTRLKGSLAGSNHVKKELTASLEQARGEILGHREELGKIRLRVADLEKLNATDVKQVLEANNALLIENETLRRSVAAYKGRFNSGRKISRRKKSSK